MKTVKATFPKSNKDGKGSPKAKKATTKIRRNKKRPLNGILNGFGTTTWLILGVVLLALGLGGVWGAAHYKKMQMDGIIDDQEAKTRGKLSSEGKKETLDKLKKLNVLEVHNFRNVLQAVQQNKLTEDKMTAKQKGYYKKTGIPLPSELPILI